MVFGDVGEFAELSRVAAWHKSESSVCGKISALAGRASKTVLGESIRVLSPWANIDANITSEEFANRADIEANFNVADTPSLRLEGLVEVRGEGEAELVEVVVEGNFDSVDHIILVGTSVAAEWFSGIIAPSESFVIDTLSVSLDNELLRGPFIGSQDVEFDDYTLVRRNTSEEGGNRASRTVSTNEGFRVTSVGGVSRFVVPVEILSWSLAVENSVGSAVAD